MPTEHTIEGEVTFRNRMGKTSIYRMKLDDDSEVMARFVRSTVGVVAYDVVKRVHLGDRLRVVGVLAPHPRLDEVLEVQRVEAM